MGAYLRPLIAILLVFCAPGAAGAASPPGCIACHRPHYASRGTCVDCHRGDPRTDRKNIAHGGLVPAAYAWFTQPDSPAVTAGAKLLEASSCRRCHTWNDRGNPLAADLGDAATVSPPRAIREAILKPAEYMPDFRFDEGQLRNIVNALLSMGRRPGDAGRAEVPLVVHFEGAGGGEELVFSRSCGGCHKVLSDTWGGVGSGASAPNLSGMFTRHYPASFGSAGRWTPENLKKWIRNPRNVKPGALMPPVSLDDGEARELIRFLSPSNGRNR